MVYLGSVGEAVGHVVESGRAGTVLEVEGDGELFEGLDREVERFARYFAARRLPAP
ncbi:hypothetical protein OTB20_23320 [Streptomyces sp. H27-H1]|nr:hypothetical protein [Streptomyces sp. H27-H1]